MRPAARIRLHDLRHTHATLGLKAGVHPKVMSERLGHATVGVTLDLYSHVVPAIAKARSGGPPTSTTAPPRRSQRSAVEQFVHD